MNLQSLYQNKWKGSALKTQPYCHCFLSINTGDDFLWLCIRTWGYDVACCAEETTSFLFFQTFLIFSFGQNSGGILCSFYFPQANHMPKH